MNLTEHFNHFDETSPDDPRISAVDISLYMALLLTFEQHARENPVPVHRTVLMKQAKISARSTYYKAMRELEEFAYIPYLPSRYLYTGNLVNLKKYDIQRELRKRASSVAWLLSDIKNTVPRLQWVCGELVSDL